MENLDIDSDISSVASTPKLATSDSTRSLSDMARRTSSQIGKNVVAGIQAVGKTGASVGRTGVSGVSATVSGIQTVGMNVGKSTVSAVKVPFNMVKAYVACYGAMRMPSLRPWVLPYSMATLNAWVWAR
jgi:hypothetical protein